MNVRWERIKAAGEDLLAQLERLVHEGNVRRIRVKQGSDIVAEFPLTVGVVGALGAPAVAAVGALAALLTHCSIEVLRIDPNPARPAPAPAGPKARARRSPPRPRSRS